MRIVFEKLVINDNHDFSTRMALFHVLVCRRGLR